MFTSLSLIAEITISKAPNREPSELSKAMKLIATQTGQPSIAAMAPALLPMLALVSRPHCPFFEFLTMLESVDLPSEPSFPVICVVSLAVCDSSADRCATVAIGAVTPGNSAAVNIVVSRLRLVGMYQCDQTAMVVAN